MILSYRGISPKIHESCFVAESASVVGDVTIGEDSSVWYGAVIRGDEDSLVIGRRTSIQDNAVIHCNEGFPVKIGDNVTVGHGAIVHGCTVGDNALIGMGATVLDGAVIGENAVVGAGAVVKERDVIPEGAVAVGIPAKVVKIASEHNSSMNSLNAEAYVQLGRNHKNG